MPDYAAARWDANIEARFMGKVAKDGDTGCWNWTGVLTPGGYGQFSIDNRHYAAHRLLSVKSGREIGPGLVCDHLCRNRRCVNPAHIDIVTTRENILRGIAGELNRAKGAAVTHCVRGHEYTPENTRMNKGRRSCRACDKVYSDALTEKRRQLRARASTPNEKG